MGDQATDRACVLDGAVIDDDGRNVRREEFQGQYTSEEFRAVVGWRVGTIRSREWLNAC